MGSRLLIVLTSVTFILALYGALVYAPPERTLGDLHRIFYFHVSSAWIGLLAFAVAFVSGVVYLARGERRSDQVAAVSVELGVLFSTMTLIVGSIWARSTWNTWWIWEPRLTSMLILWLIYVGYLLLRSMMPDSTRRARMSAVVSTVGFVDVPIVFLTIRWWRSLHPVVLDRSGFHLDSRMLLALLISVAAFSLLYACLLVLRLRIEGLADDVEELRGEWPS